jgi:hypothetical protein
MHGARDVQRFAAGSSPVSPGLGTSVSAGSPTVETGAPQEGDDDAAGAANANDAIASAPTEAARLPIVIVDALPSRSSAVRNLPESFFLPAGRRGKRGHAYHGAPRIVVDVPRASGAIPADALQRVARDLGYWPFRRCYEEALRRTPTVHGTVFLRVAVAADGSVERIAVAEPAQDPVLSEPAVSGCVARETAGIAFEGGDAESEAILAVVLTPGDTPLPSAPAAAGAASLRDALRALWPAAGRCYEAGLKRHRWLGGPMELRFAFEDDFSLDVVEAGTRFADGAVTDCVKDVYRGSHLQRGADSAFFYNLDFEPDVTPSEREPP